MECKLDETHENCCRTCLGHTLNEVYTIYTNISDSMSVADVLAHCTSIKVDNDDILPKKLCSNCYNCLASFYNFRKLAEQIDAQLKHFEDKPYPKGSGIKIEVDDCSTIADDMFVDIGDTESLVKEESLQTEVSNNTFFCTMCMTLCENFDNFQKHLHSHTLNNIKLSLKCEICPKQFKNATKFHQHRIKHSSGKIKTETNKKKTRQFLDCAICSSSFKSLNSLAAHMRKHVQKGRVLACSVCGKVFKKVSHLKRHELSHDLSQSQEARKVPQTTADDSQKDPGTNANEALEYLECDHCSSHFKSLHSLAAHMRKHAKKNRVLACSVCGKVFQKVSHVKRHELCHDLTQLNKTDDKPGIKEFNNSSIGPENEMELDLECDNCSAHFKSLNSLAAHMRKHTKKGRVLSCSICGKVFKKVSHVKRHELCHDINRPHQCSVCPKRFHTESLLKEHLDKHNNKQVKPHLCPICPKAFSHLSTLTAHLRIHTRDRPYLCPTCGKKFDSSTNLNQHVKRHMGLKLFACDSCPKKFISKGELQSHTITHTGERSWTCDQCGASFTKRSSLKQHKLRHAGVKPHHCDVCPMKFTTKDHLKRHYRIHTGEKPYQCDLCDRAFTQSNDLIKHKRSHLGDKLYKCTECPESFRLHSQLRHHTSEHFVSSQHQGVTEKSEDSAKANNIEIDTRSTTLIDSDG